MMEKFQNDSLRPLRQILPAPPGRCNSTLERTKRSRISAACEACRTRKSKVHMFLTVPLPTNTLKCNGERPECGECISRGTCCRSTETETRKVKRIHEEMNRRLNAHEELFELLRTMPEQDAAELFRRIRAGSDAATILTHVRDGGLLIRLSLVS